MYCDQEQIGQANQASFGKHKVNSLNAPGMNIARSGMTALHSERASSIIAARAKQSRAKQSKAKQSKAKQSKAKQSKAEQSKAKAAAQNTLPCAN